MTTPLEPVLPPVVTPPAPALIAPHVNLPEGQYFTLEQVNAAREAARKEANDRLYPRLEQSDERYTALIKEVDELKTAKQQADEAATARQKEIADTEEAKRLAEMSAMERFEAQQKEFADRLSQLQKDNEVKDALLAKEKQASAMRSYKDRRINEEKEPQRDQTGRIVSDGIAPQLIGYITGDTEEAIEAAIVTAKQNTTSILEGIRQARTAQISQAPGISSAAGNIGPLDQLGGEQEFSAADIAAMSLDDPRLQQLRQQHGMGRATPQQGMFPNTRAFG